MGLTDYTVGDKKLWQAGRDYERERIIKALEKHHKETKAGNTDLASYYNTAVLACIRLIKGEQK